MIQPASTPMALGSGVIIGTRGQSSGTSTSKVTRPHPNLSPSRSLPWLLDPTLRQRALSRIAQCIPQLLAHAKDDLAHFIPNHAIIGPNMATSTLCLQPRFILDDFPD